MYGLHSLQGQFTGFHFLISLFKKNSKLVTLSRKFRRSVVITTNLYTKNKKVFFEASRKKGKFSQYNIRGNSSRLTKIKIFTSKQ